MKFLNNLAALYEKTGKREEATALRARAEAMEKKLAGRKKERLSTPARADVGTVPSGYLKNPGMNLSTGIWKMPAQ